MLEDYKVSDDPVDCYREYYLKDKVRFAKWRSGDLPPWWSRTTEQSDEFQGR
tara:strand:- start:918 stop:1073 length:156 start_codon:yes stop_codon:yes gene_type:complete